MEYEVVKSHERLGSIANEILSAEVIALDLETTSFSPFDGEIRICSINTGKGIYVIDLFETKGLGPVVDALQSTNAISTLQNARFDVKWLKYKYNFDLERIFDTYRASAILYNGKGYGHNLYDLYTRELNTGPSAPDLGGTNWAGSLTKEHYDYAAEDVTFLPQLRDVLKPKLAKAGLNNTALIEFNVIVPEAEVELNGFHLNPQKWLALQKLNGQRARNLARELMKELPNPTDQLALPGFDPSFNLDSSKQILASLKKLGLDMTITVGRGDDKEEKESTGKLALAKYAAKEPLVKKLQSYRKYSKYESTYGDEYIKAIHKLTGRLHCSYFPFLLTGRYAATDPGLSTIPRDEEFRACFDAEEGWKLVLADFAGVEMRAAAHISGDPVLTKVFLDDLDAHKYTASILTDVPYSQITKKHKQDAKAVGFGLIFGMGPEKLVTYAQTQFEVDMSLEQAKTFWKKYFDAYKGVKAWHRRAVNEGMETRVSRSLSGRLRYIENESAFNEFINSSVQSSCADGLKISLRNVYDKVKKYKGSIKMVHHVHDEIILEVKDDPELEAESQRLLKEGMMEGMSKYITRVPIKVEGASGTSWAEK